ncbi:MAG TPA: amino acid permease, partial [Abditibacteriaceae bacterium]
MKTGEDHSTDDGTHGPALARTMGLGALIIYGVGDMLGSGIYALIGKAAGVMGNAIWLSFLASMVAALLTGLSYASLGSRYPRASGASYFTHRSFKMPFLSYIVGLAVIASGLTSMATQSRAFTGYLLGFFNYSLPGAATTATAMPPASSALWMGIVLLFIGALTFISFWGMRESTWLNALCTFVEVAGLILIVVVGARFWGGVNLLEVPPSPAATGEAARAITLGLVLQGAVVTFFSFVGFEDMINVAEEVKNPRRNIPLGIMAALAVTTVVYMAISITAVSVVPHAELAASSQPLVDVVKTAAPGFPIKLFSLIALFAIANTGLLNYILGSRMVYGMA